ncbi:MAG: glycosyltransferase family 2 protein [bacterium]
MIDISVIIVSWNVSELLESCLTSLRRETGITKEILVVENASRDGSADMVREKFSDVVLIVNKENRGFARANNQGIRRARGRHILLLNPDTEVHAGTLATTVRTLDEHREIGILGCSIFGKDGVRQHSVRRDPTLSSQLLILLKMHVFFPKLSALQRYFAVDFSYTHAEDVEQVMGAFLAFPAQLIERIGLLDEGFFLWFEEVDYCRRTRASGLRVRFDPMITITHAGGESFGQLLSIEQQLLFNRSLLRYFHKQHSPLAFALLALLTPLSILLAALEPIVKRWYVPKPLR